MLVYKRLSADTPLASSDRSFRNDKSLRAAGHSAINGRNSSHPTLDRVPVAVVIHITLAS
jgi:hypothetical protein